VYPIKVEPAAAGLWMRWLEFGKPYQFGLEAGVETGAHGRHGYGRQRHSHHLQWLQRTMMYIEMAMPGAKRSGARFIPVVGEVHRASI